MNLTAATKEKLTLTMSVDEARHLLAALQDHREIVGDFGHDLAGKLSAAGIQPPAAPDHIRYEYMPPTK